MQKLHQLSLIRVDRRLTQTELARQVGWSQGFLSRIEEGSVEPSSDQVELLAEALYCNPRLLALEPPETQLTPCVHSRKRKSLPAKVINPLRASITLTHLFADRIFSGANMVATGIQARTPDGGLYEPEDIALEVRRDLGYEDHQPTIDLVTAVEAKGTPVVQIDLDTEKVDALTSAGPDGGTLVQLNTSFAPARRRFSLAHELGHIVMHGNTASEDREAEADRFAAALLMPQPAIRGSLRNPDIGKLRKLAEKWQVSTRAILRRGRDLGEIGESQYKRLIIELGKAGYRNDDAISVEIDRSQRVLTGVNLLVADGWGIDQIENYVMCSGAELTDRFGVEI